MFEGELVSSVRVGKTKAWPSEGIGSEHAVEQFSHFFIIGLHKIHFTIIVMHKPTILLCFFPFSNLSVPSVLFNVLRIARIFDWRFPNDSY